MDIQLFSDLIDALGKVAEGIKTLANIPKNEREKYRQVMDDTYRLIDTTLNMVIIRLGDILHQDEANFLLEVAKLDNYQEWSQVEREFRLCLSLRVALREMETLSGKLVGKMSTKDWDALLNQLRSILGAEDDVANFIAMRLSVLAGSVINVAPGTQASSTVRNQVTAFREGLKKERQLLIQQEIEMYPKV